MTYLEPVTVVVGNIELTQVNFKNDTYKYIRNLLLLKIRPFFDATALFLRILAKNYHSRGYSLSLSYLFVGLDHAQNTKGIKMHTNN